MTRKNTIQENLASKDDFVRNLYADLQGRIQSFEKGDSRIEQMKAVDAKGSLLIVGVIVSYLVLIVVG